MSAAPAGTQAVDRAAALIELVVRSQDPVSFTELRDETGLARSTTSRLLAALERTSLVERDPTGGYVAGPLFALHAAVHDPWPQVARLARPVLEAVGHSTGETVHLGVARGSEVVHMGQVDSTYLLAARDWNVVDVPPHCSALGKVLYAFDALPLPSGRLERRTDQTVATREALLAELEDVRQVGYAVTLDELETGLSGVAAPVPARDGMVCAIGVSGPTARLADRLDTLGSLLVQQAGTISTLLGRAAEPRPVRTDHGTTPSGTPSTPSRTRPPRKPRPRRTPRTPSKEGAA